MTDKYLVINIETEETWFVEMSSSQADAMKWLTEKLDIDIRFIEMYSGQIFEKI